MRHELLPFIASAERAHANLWRANDAARESGAIDLFDWTKRRAALNRALATRLYVASGDAEAMDSVLRALKGVR